MSTIVDDRPGLDVEVRSLRQKVADLEAHLSDRSPSVRILSEPLTYEARLVKDNREARGVRAVATRQNHCYLRDLVMYETRGDERAKRRLDRHAQEMRIIGEERERIFHPEVEYDFEQRAVSWVNGQGGYFAPPLWIIEHFATVPTPERVLADKAPNFELPVGAQSINLPAWTAGGEMGVQAPGGAVASTDTLDTAISSTVATIAGNYDVPMQMLEQSPQGAHLDWVAFTNMEARYGFQLEYQMLNGAGAATPQGSGNPQLMGIFNHNLIPAANKVSYTKGGEGSATGATDMFSFLGLLVAKVGQSRLRPPEAWLMSTSRSAWLGSSEDQQARPLMIVDNSTAPGVYDLLAYPVFPDDAIPRTLGATQNEDRVIVCRPSDWLVLESERRTSVFQENLSGTLMARIQMRRYAAALLCQPTSVAYLLGSGMATAGGF